MSDSPSRDARVSLWGDQLAWNYLPKRAVRVAIIASCLGWPIPALIGLGLAWRFSPWWLILPALCLVAFVSDVVTTVRTLPLLSWIELEQEIVIRHGRLFRTLTSVPYGRIQYVDVDVGPLQRRYSLASVKIHTAASGAESADIPDLDQAEAEGLRDRLSARGEAQRVGL